MALGVVLKRADFTDPGGPEIRIFVQADLLPLQNIMPLTQAGHWATLSL